MELTRITGYNSNSNTVNQTCGSELSQRNDGGCVRDG